MNIFHVKRNYRIPLIEQKKQLKEEFRDVAYISSDGRGTITVFAEGRKKNEVSRQLER